MISFIVIGKNESFRLLLSINSIFAFVKNNQISDYEIIYVDSKSTDGSLENLIQKAFPIKIASLTGDCNAAIGRNSGARIAKGSILFFMDGDMELNPDFDINPILRSEKKYLLASGQIINHFYDDGYLHKIGVSEYYKNLSSDRTEIFFGGLFIIEKALWDKYNGMRNNFVYGEDIDLSMRLSNDGYKLVRSQAALAYHHTVEKKLSLKELIRNACYSRGYLYRKNIFNKYLFKRIIGSDPTVPCLVLGIILSFLSHSAMPVVGYFLIVVIAVLFTRQKSLPAFFVRLLQQIIRDFFVLLSALFYYPNHKKESFTLIR